MGNAKPGGSNPLVVAHDIGVRRSERWIVRHVDLEVVRGELVYLIGANGAGKSTCAKAILGLIDLNEGKVDRAPSLEVGYVPQRLPISPTLPLTVRRLITLTGRFAPAILTLPWLPSVCSGWAIRRSRLCREASFNGCCSLGL